MHFWLINAGGYTIQKMYGYTFKIDISTKGFYLINLKKVKDKKLDNPLIFKESSNKTTKRKWRKII
jgi:hypothetical protein